MILTQGSDIRDQIAEAGGTIAGEWTERGKVLAEQLGQAGHTVANAISTRGEEVRTGWLATSGALAEDLQRLGDDLRGQFETVTRSGAEELSRQSAAANAALAGTGKDVVLAIAAQSGRINDVAQPERLGPLEHLAPGARARRRLGQRLMPSKRPSSSVAARWSSVCRATSASLSENATGRLEDMNRSSAWTA